MILIKMTADSTCNLLAEMIKIIETVAGTTLSVHARANTLSILYKTK